MKIQKETAIFWIISGAAALSMYIVGFFVGEVEAISLHFNWVVFGFQIFYLIISFRTQRQNEIGGKLFFGRFIQETRPGPVVAWAGIIEHHPEDASPQNTEFPTDLVDEKVIEPEDAKRMRDPQGGGGDGVDHYRMTHKGVDEGDEKSLDPLAQGRLTTEVTMVLSWRIKDIKAFLTNAVSRKKFIRQAEDSIVGETRKEFKKGTAAKVYAKWGDVEKDVKTHTEHVLSKELNFGVEISNFAIKKIDLTHEINTAFSTQISSGIRIKSEENRGLADKVFKELSAQGDKALRKAFLDGEAEGFENIAARLGLPKDQAIAILQSQVVRNALEKANFNLLSTGGDVLGVVGAIQQVLETNKGKIIVKE